MDYREAEAYVRGLIERDHRKIFVGRDGEIESVYWKLDEYISDAGGKDFSQEIMDIIQAQYDKAAYADAVWIVINRFQDDEWFDAVTVSLLHGVALAVWDLIPEEKLLQ